MRSLVDMENRDRNIAPSRPIPLPEISIYEFNPNIHQIACRFGHIGVQPACHYCHKLCAKLKDFVPIDPTIQSAELGMERFSVFYKAPVVHHPPSVTARVPLSEDLNLSNKLLHFHARDINQECITSAADRDMERVAVTDSDRDQHNTIERNQMEPSNEATGPAPRAESGSNATHAASVETAAANSQRIREYTRTPSITMSMRDAPLPQPQTTHETSAPLTGFVEHAMMGTFMPANIPPASQTKDLENQIPSRISTASGSPSSKTSSSSPIKARKAARRPAWAKGDTLATRSSSQNKVSKLTPKRLKALEGLVNNLRDEFGNLKLQVERQEQDRDMAELFFG